MFNPILCLRRANENDLFLSLLRRAALSSVTNWNRLTGHPKRDRQKKVEKVLITNFPRLYFRYRGSSLNRRKHSSEMEKEGLLSKVEYLW